MAIFRFLQISDLHFGETKTKDPYETNLVLRPLLKTLKDRVAGGEGPHAIFVTGDLGFSGQQSDYRLCEKFITELLDVTGLSSDDLWLVPGNHDVRRDSGLYARTLANEGESREFFGKADRRKGNLAKFQRYQAFIKRLGHKELATGDVVRKPGIIDTPGIDARIAVLPLNSAWFCQDDHDAGNLWLGVRTVKERVESLDSHDLLITLMHHPMSDLHEKERAGDHIEKHADIVLSGHLHHPKGKAEESAAGRAICITAGATYQGADYPCLAFLGRLDTGDWTLELEPIQYDSSAAADNWVIDPGVFPSDASNGHKRTFYLRSGVGPKRAYPPFPYSDWASVNSAGWESNIISWFGSAYKIDPVKAMSDLLDHVFQIICEANGQDNICKNVMDLGQGLQRKLPSDLPDDLKHHSAVMRLLSMGIHHNMPRLFMLPSVSQSDLLMVPRYSQLLLATRYLAAGYYEEAAGLCELVGADCRLAMYVKAQCLRESNHLDEARLCLQDADSSVDCFGSHVCCVSSTGNKICNQHLLKAEVQRALAVVHRNLENHPAAEKHFELATEAANQALKSIARRQRGSTASPAAPKSTYHAGFSQSLHRVIADIHFSHGYYWYKRKEFDKASQLFQESIMALKCAHEQWDSPYTRLAIVKSVEGDYDVARDLFLQARQICERSDIQKNRQAPLSLALCTLGLKVVVPLLKTTGSAVNDPMKDLLSALEIDPPLDLGPLKCHRDDALLLLNVAKASGTERDVQAVVDRLNHEIDLRTAGRKAS